MPANSCSTKRIVPTILLGFAIDFAAGCCLSRLLSSVTDHSLSHAVISRLAETVHSVALSSANRNLASEKVRQRRPRDSAARNQDRTAAHVASWPLVSIDRNSLSAGRQVESFVGRCCEGLQRSNGSRSNRFYPRGSEVPAA